MYHPNNGKSQWRSFVIWRALIGITEKGFFRHLSGGEVEYCSTLRDRSC